MGTEKIVYPQEIELFYLMPAIRREMVIVMRKKGLEQRKIALLLGITEAAVSQYLSKKRANEIKFDKKTLLKIEKYCDDLVKSGGKITKGIIEILNYEEVRRIKCEIHKNKGGDRNCRICNEIRREYEKNN